LSARVEARDVESRPALGRDPLEESDSGDLFVDLALAPKEGVRSDRGLPPVLDEVAELWLPEWPGAAESADVLRRSRIDGTHVDGPRIDGLRVDEGHGPGPARGWLRTPALAEVEPPPIEDWADRLLDEQTRRRVAAISHLLEGEAGFDRFGLSVDTLRRSLPIFLALHRHYFRVRSRGAELIPAGPVVMAANHGGLLPFDGAMIVVDLFLQTDPPRLARTILDHFAGRLPWVNVFFARVGQIVGTSENFADLLDQGQLVLVFPEGMEGIKKNARERYRLQRFHVGFVEQALRTRAPIVPTAVIGSDDQAPILFDLKPLARLVGLPFAPITPTFPLLGPLGLLPYPVRYEIVYGEPMDFHERFGPEDADDPRLVHFLAKQVRSRIQQLIDENR
jgi:1-acyl-sn-glycerol-3-phosphate acyltransferase